MRLYALLAAVGLLSQSALAETPACKTVSNAAARLACYDNVNRPAVSRAKSAAAKPPTAMPTAAPAAKSDAAEYVDTIGAEDARMNLQLKNICRGC